MTDYDKAFELLKNVSKRAEDVRECELQLTMAKELLMKHLQDEATASTSVKAPAATAPMPTPAAPPTWTLATLRTAPSWHPPPSACGTGKTLAEATNDASEALTESMNPVDPSTTANPFCDTVAPAKVATKSGRGCYHRNTNPRPARERYKGEWEKWFRSAQYIGSAKKLAVGKPGEMEENGKLNRGVWLTQDEYDLVLTWVNERRKPKKVIQLPTPQHNQ